MSDFEKLYNDCLENIISYPEIADALSKELNISIDAIYKLGVGFHPGRQAWIFAERNHKGGIVGIMCRKVGDGKDKRVIEDSKRGLTYPVGDTTYRKIDNRILEINGTAYWRLYVGEGIECPVCHHDHWCLVDVADKQNPACVICPRIKEGSVRTFGAAGHLHILRGKTPKKQSTSLLPTSDDPVIITEGASDCLTALGMGFVAVGKPGALIPTKWLVPLLKGRDTVIVGDNDKPGQEGAKECLSVLKFNNSIKSARLVFPPEKYRDLRAWSPSREEFLTHIRENATEETEFEPVRLDYYELAAKFLTEKYETNGQRTLHFLWPEEQWRKHNGSFYDKHNLVLLEQEFYTYFSGLKFTRPKSKDGRPESILVDRRFLDEIKSALRAHCLIEVPSELTEPFNIEHKHSLGLDKHIVFSNGVLNPLTNELRPLNPDIYITSTLPYPYDPKALCPTWRWFVASIFNNDSEQMELLRQWVGYNMIASDFLESFMIFYGVPNSGKGTCQNVMQTVLGKRRYVAANINSFTTNFGLAPLIGKYGAFISEYSASSRVERARLLSAWKAIVGRDEQSIDRKYKSTLTEKLFVKITYSCNDLPDFNDPTLALDRRINLLHFTNDYAKAGTLDPNLKTEVVKEAPGIAIWALGGLKQLLESQKFIAPLVCGEVREEIRESLNPILAMKHYLKFGLEEWETTNRLFDLYLAMCEEEKTERKYDSRWFGRKFSHAFPELERQQQRIGSEQTWGYKGVRITHEAEQHYLGKP